MIFSVACPYVEFLFGWRKMWVRFEQILSSFNCRYYWQFSDPFGGLRFEEALCKIFGGPLSYVEHAKIFGPFCENLVTATCFVCISILTGASV